jgi:hypothetical protein
MTSTIERGAEAMRARRRELIAQPLDRIWPELMKTALAVVHEPTTYDHPYNDGYTHEALHTAHVLLDTWDQHVFDTRTCDEFPDVREAVQKAADAMHAAYQLIGQKFHETAPANHPSGRTGP